MDLIQAVEDGHLITSTHAQQRMQERGIDLSDLEEAVFKGRREEHKDSLTDDKSSWKYAIRGMNVNGDKDLRLIVLYVEEPKMLLITAIDLDQ